MSKGSSVCVSLAQLGVCRLIRGEPPHSGHGIVPARIGDGNGLLLHTGSRCHQIAASGVWQLIWPNSSRGIRVCSGVVGGRTEI